MAIMNKDNLTKEQVKKLEEGKSKKTWKRKLIKYILIITLIAGASIYGLTRPGVITNIRSGVKYLSPDLQKKAWNEAKREIIEGDIKANEQELQQVKGHSFWNEEVIQTAHAAVLPDDGGAISTGSEEDLQQTGSNAGHGDQGNKPSPTGSTTKSLAANYSATVGSNRPFLPDSKDVYPTFDKIVAASDLTAEQKKTFKKVCEAETGMRMVPNSAGASSAYGPCQLLKVHDTRAQKLGFANRNVSLEANIITSLDLFKEQGTTPWNESKHMKGCKGWGDTPTNCPKGK